MTTWLLMIYKIPREPTAGRVYIWRKLKRLGAILLQDAIWVLPLTPWTREQFQWLAAEVQELGGEATLWESRVLPPGGDEALIAQFRAQVDREYQEILAALQQAVPDLPALARRYQQAQRQDYFASDLGQQVRARLQTARGGGDA